MLPPTSGPWAGRPRHALILTGALALAATGVALTRQALLPERQAAEPAAVPAVGRRPVRSFLAAPPAAPPAAILPPPASTGPATPALGFHGAGAPPDVSRFFDLPDAALGELAREAEASQLRADLLGELGRRRAGLLTLLAFVDDGSDLVRAAAAEGLRRLGNPRAIHRLREAAAREGVPEVRAAMAEALDSLARVAISPH